MSHDVYPITPGTYAQTIGEIVEKTLGVAILTYTIMDVAANVDPKKGITGALIYSLLLFGTATAITQFTLIYTKSKREAEAEEKKDTFIIRFLTKHTKVTTIATYLAAAAEGLGAAAAIIRFGLKANLAFGDNNASQKSVATLTIVAAVLALYSRYKKINYVDAQEVRNEYEMRNAVETEETTPTITESDFPFKERIHWCDPKLTNYLSYQVSPTLENALNMLGPYMFYEDVSQFMPDMFNNSLLFFCISLIILSCYGEYCSQIQDSKWYRDNAFRTYGKEEVNTWTHHPYWFGNILLEIAKLPGRFAQQLPNTDPTMWIYNGIKASKVAGYTALLGAAPFELYKVIMGDEAHPPMAAGIPMALVGMTVGFFAGRGQCYARDKGLRHIAAYLGYTIGATRSNLRIPSDKDHSLGLKPYDVESAAMKNMTSIVDEAIEEYRLTY